jgi:uncharacterized protein (TIRG00374 family)
VAFFVGGVVLLILIFKKKDFAELTEGFQQVNYWWIVAAKLVGSIAHFTRAQRWRLLMKPLGYSSGMSSTFFAMMTGYLTNIVTPKMGEFVRCFSLKKSDNVPIPSSLGTVIIERSIDMLTVILIFGVVFLFNFQLIDSFVTDNIVAPLITSFKEYSTQGNLLIVASATFIIIIVAALIINRYQKGKALGIFTYPLSLFQRITNGLMNILRMDQKGRFLLYTCIMWLFYLFAFYTNFYAFEATSQFGLASALLVFSFSAIGWAVPVQASIGAYHWIVTQGLILLGLSFAEGLIFATVVHAAGIIYNFVIGSLSFILILLTTEGGISRSSIKSWFKQSRTIDTPKSDQS